MQSKDVVGVINGYYTLYDLGFTSLKQQLTPRAWPRQRAAATARNPAGPAVS